MAVGRFRQSYRDKKAVLRPTLIITEIVRWLVIATNVLLAVWRYGEIMGYTIFIQNVDVRSQFWGVTVGLFLLGSLVLYLPLKLVLLLVCYNARHAHGWRPSILLYSMSVLPCFILILIAVRSKNLTTFDEWTITVMQVVVFGLTITEWMAKLREEPFSYNLISDMGTDFFTAYDIIEMLMVADHNRDVFTSHWLYITYGVGFLAFFKYVPIPPVHVCSSSAADVTKRGTVIYILVNMFLQDIPFVVVRFTIMGLYGMKASDFIHPVKNVVFVMIYIFQLVLLFSNNRTTSAAGISFQSLVLKAQSVKRREKDTTAEERSAKCNTLPENNNITVELDALDRHLDDELMKSGVENTGFKSDDLQTEDLTNRTGSLQLKDLPGSVENSQLQKLPNRSASMPRPDY
ncbi:unnamed protein product [Owenia fusiformis]|uniref:Uncharacterized protein n=1 Tax=Owenia fusiformis TaxID=6347 RepID=A0A8J1U7T9_OWEFU|nr:unnamed protein product [Owenia fusiformis]